MKREIIEREFRKISTEAALLASYIDRIEWNRVEVSGVAGIVASIYSGYESIFVNLCKNKVQKKDHWHKELLKNAVAGVIPPELEDIMGDMLAFRHVQRNYYTHELTEAQVRQKAHEVLEIVIPAFDEHLKNYGI